MSTASNAISRFGWSFLIVIFLSLGFVYSIIQPLGRTPDEIAHVQYVAFLADHQRLPIFDSNGGGEAGYEAQHPPLYYAGGAIIYGLTSSLGENVRWHLLRWATLLFVGVPIFLVAQRFFRELWPNREYLVMAATASVVLMPLTLLYVGYVNPDGLVLLWGALVLLDGSRAARQPASNALSIRLGIWAGLALLTKLSGFPLLIVAVAAHLFAGKEQRLKRIAITVGAALVLALPWYVRNLALYGSPFIHTNGKYGTGLENALAGGFTTFGWLTWRESFLSTWIQRGWLPDGLISWMCYGFIIASVLCAALGLIIRRKSSPDANLRHALNLSGIAITLTFLGQQWAYWTQDVEFNAGGRYLLATLPGIILLLFVGWEILKNRRRVWIGLWLAVLVVMNGASIWNLTTHLNPKYAPNWTIFQFPPGETPKFR